MIKKLIKYGGILVLISIVASVFLGGDDTSSNSNSTPDTTQATPVSNCSNVGSSLLKVIYEGDGFELTNGKSVKFGDNPPARYVSAEFTNSGSLGIDGEGVMIGKGDLSNKPYLKKAFNTRKTKVLEVWQGHLDDFKGFRESLKKTLKYFKNE